MPYRATFFSKSISSAVGGFRRPRFFSLFFPRDRFVNRNVFVLVLLMFTHRIQPFSEFVTPALVLARAGNLFYYFLWHYKLPHYSRVSKYSCQIKGGGVQLRSRSSFPPLVE